MKQKLLSISSFLLSFIYCVNCYGQSLDKPRIYEDPIAQSSNVSNMGSFKAGGVNGFTGRSNISIPVYEVKVRDQTFPISLTYDDSGIKVAGNAGWVGMNWSLNVGGSISRVVNGAPDDIKKESSQVSSDWSILVTKEYGFLLGGGQKANDFTDVGKSEAQVYARIHAINGTNYQLDDNLNLAPIFREGAWGQRYDTQPDLFYFNLFGKSSKFVFGADQKIKFFQNEPFKGEFIIDNSPNPKSSKYTKGIISFTITDACEKCI